MMKTTRSIARTEPCLLAAVDLIEHEGGHIAGVGTAVVGSLTTLISMSLGAAIGWIYDGTVLPLVAGFALLGLAAIAVMCWTERGR